MQYKYIVQKLVQYEYTALQSIEVEWSVAAVLKRKKYKSSVLCKHTTLRAHYPANYPAVNARRKLQAEAPLHK